MEELKRRIVEDGRAIGDGILKVDSFLNHQIDVKLLDSIGAEFERRFSDVKEQVDKILTIESSGIAVSCFTAKYFGYPPVVFAKKEKPSTMIADSFSENVFSFTKQREYSICVSKQFIASGDRVLIIDDFLACGNAALALAGIIEQAGAICLGAGIVIEKSFQDGSEKLNKAGIRVESLAMISKIENGKIIFSNS